MHNSWKYAQVIHLPEDNKCECNHYRSQHNNMKGFCLICMNRYEKCEKFRKWSVERVREFWQVANIAIHTKTGTEQTIMDDYLL
jgi:hypothetical protein